MTNKEERPAGCVLRLFGAPEQTVQKAVEALPDTWQGTVHCRSRGAETLVALQSSTPQQLHCWCAVIPLQERCWRPGWKTFPARKRYSILAP